MSLWVWLLGVVRVWLFVLEMQFRKLAPMLGMRVSLQRCTPMPYYCQYIQQDSHFDGGACQFLPNSFSDNLHHNDAKGYTIKYLSIMEKAVPLGLKPKPLSALRGLAL
jgi:hypothetical protein